ncbi:uncharacterized protein LOC111291798 [Durio zibethinus]|uniref:Uncharacterized protein LOC111291798 n=1 Tax=Durio zibethinus TaxID=66656 RepID=A0A6P5YGT6_DURZI|nr:uncharacterized protein LOC111291798 [Durio zibethinus]XP_022739557.1 uncharacterized protein LOC111291798 [Durio zibethinus]
MEAFEKEAKTFFEDKSLDQDAKPLREGSTVAAAFAIEKSWENGVRVSVNGKEGSCLDEDGERLEDSEMNGVSSLLQMKGSVRNIDINGGSESVEGFGTLLGAVYKSKEIGVENVLPSGDDGVSLEDIHVEIDGKERSCLDDEQNGGGMIMVKVNEIDDDGGVDLGFEFSAGDFVWGKIRSHPWWPGQVYNPSDASDYAVKVRQKGRLLVAYFGDSSFAWCLPSQLKPFEENFEDMSKLSNSKNFLNAVQTSVGEIGRLVELKMTCSCVPKENCSGLDRPLAANAGIKKGVLVPEGGIGKLSIGLFKPEEILGKLKQIAPAVSTSNLLECTVLKGWLSAFSRSIRHCPMPIHHKPLSIPDPEENVRTLVVDMSDYNEAVAVPIIGPVEEDWTSSSGTKFGQCSLRCPEILEDGIYQRRKQKSIAEIIKGEFDVLARKYEDVAQKGTNSGEQASSSWGKKMKGNNKANGDDALDSISIPRKRKGTELSGSLTTRKGKMSSVETDISGAQEEMDKGYSSRGRKMKSKGASNNNDGSGGKEETKNHPVLAKRKVNVGSGVGNSDAKTKDLIESGSLLRERKKSKYLSPPYTSPTGKQRKMDIESESLKVSNGTQVKEQATGNLVMSPPVLGVERNQLTEEVHAEQGALVETNFHSPKQDLNKKIDPAKVKTPANEVLIEVRSVALSPQYRRKNNSFEIVVGFLSVFRSSVYQNGSNYEPYNQFQPHRKRKSPDSMAGSVGKDQNLTDLVPAGHRSKQKKVGKNEETKVDQSNPRQASRASPKKTSEESKAYNPKIKQAARAAVMKKNDKGIVENASPAALFVTFGPGSSLPTKDDLIGIYSMYGALNLEDTDMFYNNFCARVVFLRSSDAEQAFNSSQTDSPFGASNVSFRLRLLSAASAHEHRKIPIAKPSPLTKEGAKRSKKSSASPNSADQTSQLNYIKHKLEQLTSILEISDEKMSSELKSKVQSEIKDLLEKVTTMAESLS